MKIIINYIGGDLTINQSNQTVTKRHNIIREYPNYYGNLTISVDGGEDVELVIKDCVRGNLYITAPDIYFKEIERSKINGVISIYTAMEPNFPETFNIKPLEIEDWREEGNY